MSDNSFQDWCMQTFNKKPEYGQFCGCGEHKVLIINNQELPFCSQCQSSINRKKEIEEIKAHEKIWERGRLKNERMAEEKASSRGKKNW